MHLPPASQDSFWPRGQLQGSGGLGFPLPGSQRGCRMQRQLPHSRSCDHRRPKASQLQDTSHPSRWQLGCKENMGGKRVQNLNKPITAQSYLAATLLHTRSHGWMDAMWGCGVPGERRPWIVPPAWQRECWGVKVRDGKGRAGQRGWAEAGSRVFFHHSKWEGPEDSAGTRLAQLIPSIRACPECYLPQPQLQGASRTRCCAQVALITGRTPLQKEGRQQARLETPLLKVPL